MKASIKFREEQKPLIRAKIPLNILGFPFQSGVVSGDPKELSLSLATSLDSGPSLKFAYRPNDPANPFGLVFKTGIGHFGSPVSSPMTMSAEFNLVGGGAHSPSFFVHFRPQLGDFSLKKSQSSDFVKKGLSNGGGGSGLGLEDESIEVIETPLMKNGYSADNNIFSSKKVTAVLPPEPSKAAAGMIAGLLSGMEASARTSMPLMNKAVVKLRWGFRFPPEEATGMGKDPMRKLPLLVMNKISIEHVTDDRAKESSNKVDNDKRAKSEVEDVPLAVKRQLEMIQSENGMLRKAVNDLRYEFACGRSMTAGARATGGEKRSLEYEGFGGKLKKDGDLKEELKK